MAVISRMRLLLLLLVVKLVLIRLQLMYRTVNKSRSVNSASDGQQSWHCHAAKLAGGSRLLMVVMRCRGNGLHLASWPVLVVRMVDHVLGAKSLRFVDELAFVGVTQKLPRGAETLRDLRVVHLRVFLVQSAVQSLTHFSLMFPKHLH